MLVAVKGLEDFLLQSETNVRSSFRYWDIVPFLQNNNSHLCFCFCRWKTVAVCLRNKVFAHDFVVNSENGKNYRLCWISRVIRATKIVLSRFSSHSLKRTALQEHLLKMPVFAWHYAALSFAYHRVHENRSDYMSESTSKHRTRLTFKKKKGLFLFWTVCEQYRSHLQLVGFVQPAHCVFNQLCYLYTEIWCVPFFIFLMSVLPHWGL